MLLPSFQSGASTAIKSRMANSTLQAVVNRSGATTGKIIFGGVSKYYLDGDLGGGYCVVLALVPLKAVSHFPLRNSPTSGWRCSWRQDVNQRPKPCDPNLFVQRDALKQLSTVRKLHFGSKDTHDRRKERQIIVYGRLDRRMLH
ncbi:hypothetical protein Bca4012_039578 [Brassica carinata]